MKAFVYEWREEEDNDDNEYVIKGYAIDDMGRDVIVAIDDFTPYFYIELPQHIEWAKQSMLLRTFNTRLHDMLEHAHLSPPRKAVLLSKRKLYAIPSLTFPFLFVTFATKSQRDAAARFLMRHASFTIFNRRFSVRCHEYDVSPILQMLCFRDLAHVGWIQIPDNAVDDVHMHANPLHTEHHQYTTSFRKVVSCDDSHIPPIRVLSFDIEVYSSVKTKMPDARRAEDCIFQISLCCRGEGEISPSDPKKGEISPKTSHTVVLTLGHVHSHHAHECHIEECTDERELLLAFTRYVRSFDPHVLMGYNIFGFDLGYMMDRASFHGVMNEWSALGKVSKLSQKEKKLAWSSSAYQHQEFRFLDIHGRLCVDLLPLIRREYKLRNYKLSTVASHFVGQTKDPVTPRDMFDFFEFTKDHPHEEDSSLRQAHEDMSSRMLATIATYCAHDAELVLKLFDHLEVWVGCIEMAKLCNVPVTSLYTQGQQLKVYSQIYKMCLPQSIVVESSVYHTPSAPTSYAGAFVFEPVPGIYEHILPFDFSSLYPTTIIAYNIDYSTFVDERLYATIDVSTCHIVEWAESDGTVHHFRFLKEPKGVLPQLLEHLLDRRRETKKEMKSVDKSSFMHTVLEKRQLAYKISANSVYGAMGVQKGKLPFLQGAMATTAMGRHSIHLAADFIRKRYNAHLVYGDTDSIYCAFPMIPRDRLWAFAHTVEKEFTHLFPPPMRLVFEEKVYRRFLIFTKKRYIATTQNADMTVDTDLTLRGVLLARRDNCAWISRIYERLVRMVMSEEKPSLGDIDYVISQEYSLLCAHTYSRSDVTVTKALGKEYAILECPGYDAATRTVTDDLKWRRRLQSLSIDPHDREWLATYRERVLPAHSQLAAKMTRRGFPIPAGTRMELCMTHHVDTKAKAFMRIEDPTYVSTFSDVVPLDFLHVIHLATNPLEQLLHVCALSKPTEHIARTHYLLRCKKVEIMNEIRLVVRPGLTDPSP
jgi:DNA polymerase elongation subunit (family B)